jgi:hypothetical protein
MGTLKQELINLDSTTTEYVLSEYGEFLVRCMKDHSIPNSWRDAINSIYQVSNLSGKSLTKLQIEFILFENTESLYEE